MRFFKMNVVGVVAVLSALSNTAATEQYDRKSIDGEDNRAARLRQSAAMHMQINGREFDSSVVLNSRSDDRPKRLPMSHAVSIQQLRRPAGLDVQNQSDKIGPKIAVSSMNYSSRTSSPSPAPTSAPTSAPSPAPSPEPVFEPIRSTVSIPNGSRSQPAMFDSFESFFEVNFQVEDISQLTETDLEEAVLELVDTYNNLPEIQANPDLRFVEEVEIIFDAPNDGGNRRKLQRSMAFTRLIVRGRCNGCSRRSRFTTNPNRSRRRNLQQDGDEGEDNDEGLPTEKELFSAYDICISKGHIGKFELVDSFREGRVDEPLPIY